MKNGSTLSWQAIVPHYLPLHFCPLKTGLQGLSKGTVLIIDHGNWVNTFEKTTRVNLIAVSISNKLILTEIVPFVWARSRYLAQIFCPAKNIIEVSLLTWTRPLLNWNHPSQVDGPQKWNLQGPGSVRARIAISNKILDTHWILR